MHTLTIENYSKCLIFADLVSILIIRKMFLWGTHSEHKANQYHHNRGAKSHLLFPLVAYNYHEFTIPSTWAEVWSIWSNVLSTPMSASV